jgi:hypothetical protein
MKNYSYVYETVVHQFSQNLSALKNILQKTKAHADYMKFDANKFLDMKFAPDMFAFCKQIQMTTDNAKGAAARLAGKEIPVFVDDEKTMDDLIARVQKTINFLEGFKDTDFSDYENKKVTFPWNPGKFLDGKTYFYSFAIPNFYFHLTTSYDLLRQAGVPIGKNDYLGNIVWKNA